MANSRKQLNSQNNEDKKKDGKNTATAYVYTYLPDPGKKGIGHTMINVLDAEGNVTITRNFYPRDKSEAKIHESTLSYLPVSGKNISNLDHAVNIEKKPPTIIQKIENLNLKEIENENKQFNEKIEKGDHGFSIRYNTKLPFNSLKGAAKDAKKATEDSGIHAEITADPFASTIMSREVKSRTITTGNCTDAVKRLLSAGGHPIESASWFNKIFTHFGSMGHIPQILSDDLKNSPKVKEITDPQQLPPTLFNAYQKAQQLQLKKQQEKKSEDRDISPTKK